MGDDSGGTYLTTNIIKLNLDVSSVLIYEIITKNMTSIKKNKKSIFLNELRGSVRGMSCLSLVMSVAAEKLWMITVSGEG